LWPRGRADRFRPPEAPAAGTDAAGTGAAAATTAGETAPAVGTDAAGTGAAAATTAGEAASGNGEADTAAAEAAEAAATAEAAAAAEAEILDMDIRTSTLIELAHWCRTLGLSEGGTRDDLANRLRDYYKLNQTSKAGAEEGGRIITIESARSTEYFTLEAVDEEYARLRGDVVVSLKDGEAVHRVTAWEILFNRTRNILTASGDVEYVKEEGDTRETFKGKSITVDLDNWAGVFIDGVSEHSVSTGETAYRFAGTLISRSDEDVTVLTRAKITNAANEEALWSLDASKIWLLPGSDWAVFNAVLKVGEVPVMYIPFFFYPADELIFHPVIGYRSREGNFVQTTTYILGRPKASSSTESSLTRTLGGGADTEKVREGIFLRSTGRRARDLDEPRLSVLADVYANLGTYIGTVLNLPSRGAFGAIDVDAGIGFSRDIYPMGTTGRFTPFANYDGTSTWNSAYFFSEEIPLRFRFNTTGSLSGTYGSMNWSLPLYSDPYVDRDFLNRSEAMDWVGLFREGFADTTTTTDPLGSYEWSLTGSSRFSPSRLAPYVTDLSISSWASTIAFKTRQSASEPASSVSPRRQFFYPDRFTLYSLSASIGGTPLVLDSSGGRSGVMADAVEGDDPFGSFGVPRPPWERPEGGGAVPPDSLQPPALAQTFDLPLSHGPRFTIDYRFNPSSSTELQYRSSSSHWMEAEDINWGNISSILSSFRSDGNITFTLADTTPLFTNSVRLFGTGSWQVYDYMNEDAEEFDTHAEREAARRRMYGSRYFSTSSEYTAGLRPFYRDPVWGNSSLQYTLRGLVARSEFDGTGDDPHWKIRYGDWTNENIDVNQLAANINASVMDKNQTLIVTTDMWPKRATLGGDATVRMWITETNARGRILDPYHESERLVEPLYFTETLNFYPSYSAQQYLVYDPQIDEITSLTSSLILNHFAASYSMARSKTYYFDTTPGSMGWKERTSPEQLNPRDFRLSYAQIFRKDGLWKNRLGLSFNINTNLIFDLQRYTYSKFTFSLGFTVSLANFVDLSFSTTSENSVIYRYFQDIPFFSLPDGEEVPGEKNLMVDLWNSFRFDDEESRRQSGFKLKSLNVSMVHHLGDWNAKLGITLTPYLDNVNKLPQDYRYRFNPEISFLVQWVPLAEIKSEITYDKDQFVIK
jgi:hypothetical protein